MLHTINKSPFGNNSFETSTRFFQQGDPVLFIEDGVYAVQANNKFSRTLAKVQKNNPVYVLGPDLNARVIHQMMMVLTMTVMVPVMLVMRMMIMTAP